MSSPQHYSTQASVSPENVFEIFLHYVGPHAPNECTVLMRPTTGICCKASERDFNYLQPQVSHSVYSMCVQVLSLHFFRSLLLTLSLLCWFYWCGCSNDLCTFVHLHANRFSICCCSSISPEEVNWAQDAVSSLLYSTVKWHHFCFFRLFLSSRYCLRLCFTVQTQLICRRCGFGLYLKLPSR